jgi:hypothetical protein
MCHTPKLTSSTIVKSSLKHVEQEEKRENKFCQQYTIMLFLSHIFQDSITRNGQKNTTFWDKVDDHYNKHHLTTHAKRIARSLETKLGTIKHNVSKCGKV